MFFVNRTRKMATSDFDTSREWEAQGDTVESRWNWKSFEIVESIAAELNASIAEITDERKNWFVAVDNGPNVSPRFDVIRGFSVGDAVSYGFNGDIYPDGEIKSISESGRVITTTTGHRYTRRKLTGSWRRAGTWSLTHGHVSKLNPEF